MDSHLSVWHDLVLCNLITYIWFCLAQEKLSEGIVGGGGGGGGGGAYGGIYLGQRWLR